MVTEIARRAGADDTSPSVSDFSSSSSSSEDESSGSVPKKRPSRQEREAAAKKRGEATAQRKKTAKMMDLQYFLEMVDHKHRYGSNLRKYHNYWKTQDTSQNFFYWLDQGEGKDVEVPECSRVRLNREQVRYLSREERLQYLVRIDEDGLFEWVKNGERVWTKDELYKDSVQGIVPVTDPTPKFEYNVPPPDGRGRYSESDSDSDSDSSSSPEDEDGKIDNTAGDEGERYVNEDVSWVCRYDCRVNADSSLLVSPRERDLQGQARQSRGALQPHDQDVSQERAQVDIRGRRIFSSLYWL